MTLCQHSTLSAGGHVSFIACGRMTSATKPGAERAHDFRHIGIPCSKSDLVGKSIRIYDYSGSKVRPFVANWPTLP